MSFHFPWMLLFLLLLPLLFRKTKERHLSLSFSHTGLFNALAHIKSPAFLYHSLFQKVLRALILVLFIMAIARPRTSKENLWEESEAVDILMIVDVSTSMLAEDFELNGKRFSRLEVVKRVISDFVSERAQDRIGVAMFAGEPMIVCPLTTDYNVLNEFLSQVRIGILPDKTAIGDALAFGINRLTHSQAKSKIVILLTDGDSNAGKIDPLLAADLASSQKVKVYTIGAGKRGLVPYPVNDPFFGKRYENVEIPINEEALTQIADKTGGKFYRATSSEGLKAIYEEINTMEKTKIKTTTTVEYQEKFYWFLIPGMLLLLLELFLTHFYFIRIP